MGVEEADKLQRMIEGAPGTSLSADVAGAPRGWTPGIYAQAGQYGQSMRDLALWVALREGDRDRIKTMIGWDDDRPYKIDPLPDRIAGAFQDLLYGIDPKFKAAKDVDQEKLDEMVEENDLPSELRRWFGECVSEGEMWWRVFVDRNVSDWPIVESYSRLDTIPLFIGRRVAAVAFIDVIWEQEIRVEGQPITEIWRHVEIQTEGLVRNLLYKGSYAGLGNSANLNSRPETDGLQKEWNHGLPVMLAGRVPNKLGRDWRLGISEFQGIKDLLLDLNEARVIMQENAKLTAQARMVVPVSALDENGQFDAGKNVVAAETLDESLDDKKPGPYTVLEYNFQADALLKHVDNLTVTALTRVGLAEQFVGGGRTTEGQAFTGTALRTRLIPTTLAAAGKGRFQDDLIPKMVKVMQMVANLPREKGGCGQSFQAADEAPHFIRSTELPEDIAEQTQRHVMAVQGEIESIYTAVQGLHPDWSDEEIEDEVERIRSDRGLGPPASEDDIPNPQDMGTGNPADPMDKAGAEASGLAAALGARQPGAVDGQSPGARPPVVSNGGPK